MLGQSVVFFTSAAVVFLCGRRLPSVGERVASGIGLSATTLGLFVLALITSIPELVVTLTALVGEGAADLALGNILGSNNFNITAIALLDAAFAGGAFLAAVRSERYAKTCRALLVLTVVVGLGVGLANPLKSPLLSVLFFSVPIILVFFLDFSKGIRESPEESPTGRAPVGAGVPAFVSFLLLAAAVVGAGIFLSRSADAIAEHRFAVGGGELVLGGTFVGTVLLAVATSLPEVTVAFAALRSVRSPDLAIATLLGSNMINILIFAVCAPLLIMRTGGSGWNEVGPVNLVNVATAVVLTSLVIAGMATRCRTRALWRFSLPTALMIPAYLGGLYLVLAWGRRFL